MRCCCPTNISSFWRASASTSSSAPEGTEENPSATSHKIALFIRENWPIITAYIVTWAVIIVIMGAMHGFVNISRPISIGLSAGIGFGVLTSIVIVGIVQQYNKRRPENKKIIAYSGWQLFRNHILQRLDPGSRTLFLSIMVTLVCLIMLRLPHGVSAIIGCIMGNHLATQLLMGPLAGNRPLRKRVDQAETRLQTIEQKLESLHV